MAGNESIVGRATTLQSTASRRVEAALKKSTVIYCSEYQVTPVSFWAHRHFDADSWISAKTFDPPLPAPVPGRGWAQLVVEFDGIELRFSSAAELDHVVDILSRNPLPTTRRLSELRGTAAGPNTHWLSRLPSIAKPLGFRRRLVAYLGSVRPREWA